jgi:hexaprenyl-diphosphate synthase
MVLQCAPIFHLRHQSHSALFRLFPRQLRTTAAPRVLSKLPPDNPPYSPTSTHQALDPYKLLAPQLNDLRDSLLKLLDSSPRLSEIAKYYFLHPSKLLRPLLVLLWSQATNGLGHDWQLKKWAAECEGAGGRAEELDQPWTRADVLNDWNPNMPDDTASLQAVFMKKPSPSFTRPTPPLLKNMATGVLDLSVSLLPTQIRLAQILEMLHVGSLLHDDAIDDSTSRRGFPSAPKTFGNKPTILGGDFLLARINMTACRLGDNEVVELITSILTNLIEGEILQLKQLDRGDRSETFSPARLGKEIWNLYLQKTYFKTASLMAKGSRAAVVLGGSKEDEIWKEAAYAYGRNLGIAFQVRISCI